MDNDLDFIVNFFLDNLNNQKDNFWNISSKYPKVIELRKKGESQLALSFLVSYLQNDFSRIFIETNGDYDDEIIPLMKKRDLTNVITTGKDFIVSRLLTNQIILNLSVNSWFSLFNKSTINDRIKENILKLYINKNIDRFNEIFSFFLGLNKERLDLFVETETNNILYDLIKINSQDKTYLWEKNLKSIGNIIQNLPSSYNFSDEFYFWIKPVLLSEYKEGNSINNLYNKLGIEIGKYPELFYKSILELKIDINNINPLDNKLFKKFSDKYFSQLNDLNIKYYSHNSEFVNLSTEESSQQEYINVLKRAIDERNNRLYKKESIKIKQITQENSIRIPPYREKKTN